MSDSSKLEYHGFSMEVRRDLKTDKSGIRGWRPRVKNREGHELSDELNAPWISQSEAKNRAVDIVRLEMAKLGEPEPPEPRPDEWRACD